MGTMLLSASHCQNETRQNKTSVTEEFLYHLTYEYWRPTAGQALLSVMQMNKRCPQGAWMMVRESPMNVMFMLEVQWIKDEVGWNEWESRNIGISWKNSWVQRCLSRRLHEIWERRLYISMGTASHGEGREECPKRKGASTCFEDLQWESTETGRGRPAEPGAPRK